MDFSKVKLVVSDMDGTLLDNNHKVSNLFFEQFEQLKQAGVKFIAASGRQYHSILGKLKPIEKDLTIVAENGALVIKNGQELFVNSFEFKQVKKFIDVIEKIDSAEIVLAGKKSAYFLKTTKELEALIAEYYCEYQILNSFKVLPEDEILKIAVFHPKGSEKNIFPYVEQFKQDWQIKISGEFWLDIALPDNHKGNAIAAIQKQLAITPEQTMAFGDYQNDIELLQNAYFSYAMENAHPDVKKVANYQTLSNQNNGVEVVLEKLLLAING